MTRNPFAHCGTCGAAFTETAWPRTCAACGEIAYRNPTPVSVVLVPVAGGLLTVRRAIPPQVGKLALPGGYVNWGESWQDAGARELFEETGVTIDAAALRLFWAASSHDGGVLLVFGLAPPLAGPLPALARNDEVSELVVLATPEELAFPLHTQAVKAYFTAH
jgi:ADP-ribose pyrophosphatase YjhB (NUDIX family)